ncbi:MAG: FMN-binding protein [Prosthecobacter sp.]|jgi:NosR/NirI family nitrous oxide reductase transcriptional regulator|uniref:FMN-binding protein n=1 Tax=Prosthecobacter sp. TaxID=1965333 RepID=UPI001A001164|nr:FMN-binding protein [Prosthecobacter sp.]MBE2286995.1 FMN-binding protein [Prosthecobacter sp.]
MGPVRHWKTLALRLWRVALLAAAVVAIRRAQQTEMAELTVERVRDFFPAAAVLMPQNGMQMVKDGSGITLGHVMQTSPEADDIIGYAGPTNTLIALDSRGKVLGLRILHSGDTTDHVAEVVGERSFFKQFTNKKPAEVANLRVDGVSGATLTSSAIAEGVLRRLGKSATTSLRFPDAITLDEVKKIEPQAAKLRESTTHPGSQEVLDVTGETIALAVRTAPASDGIVGYKGPSDTFMLMDASGSTLRGIALRRSYDTEQYVGYVTGDPAFLKTFDGMALEQIANIDFAEAGVEGVSGATQTSYGIAEGVRVRAQSLIKEKEAKRGWWTRIRWRWQDTGHVAIIAAAFAMAFTRLRGIAWCRHGHHALLVLYGGFIAGEMLSQGLLVGWAAHGTPWRNAQGLVLLAAVALLGPVFTSKQLYCHHICPHGALQQLVARRLRFQWSPSKPVERVLTKLPFLLLAFVLLSVAIALPLNLNALEPFDAYVFRVAGWASIAIAVGGLLWSLVTPLAYCRFGCPTGALFKLLRFTGDADRFGTRDWLAALCVAGVLLLAGG